MEILRTIKEVREFKRANRDAPLVLVPTMGALHEGHTSLMKIGKALKGKMIVSIYVNPLQFGPDEDLDNYPRQQKEDIEICRSDGAAAVFLPDDEVMYPGERFTAVRVGSLQDHLCGAGRPGHFDGVTTVVAKLFNIIEPTHAVFGLKDFQQYMIIKKMVEDLDFPIEIIGGEIIREAGGLAMSSRNKYLSPEERKRALNINLALTYIAEGSADGKLSADALISDAIAKYLSGIRIDYLDIYDSKNLKPVPRDLPLKGDLVAAGAFFVGSTRLIDNMRYTIR
ncbi:pantoate--beta-alanine ligase [bacterium]|nr:pantoate--beta-alanine ligase [bacterium]